MTAATPPREDQIQLGDRANLETIKRAAANGDLGLLRTRLIKTGEYVTVLCAKQIEENGEVSMIPLAQLFTDNPYDLLVPPV